MEKANKSWVAPTGRDDPAGHNGTSALDASQHRAARHQHAGRETLYGLVAAGRRAQLRSQSLLDGSKQVNPPSFHRQHNVELLGKEANRMGIGDLRENIYVHASPKCERRISMEHVSSHPAICTNVFKNGDATTSKASFTRKWIEMINRIEKNKQLQYGKIQ